MLRKNKKEDKFRWKKLKTNFERTFNTKVEDQVPAMVGTMVAMSKKHL